MLEAPSRLTILEHILKSENNDPLTELLKMTKVTPNPSKPDAIASVADLANTSQAIVYLSQPCEDHKVNVIPW